MTLLHQEGMTDAQEDEARKVLVLLDACYPGHPWSVRVMPGLIFIRHLDFEGGQWGMNLRVTEVDHDAAVLKRKIIMLAGEWLERAGLARGAADETPHGFVEGVPPEFQAPSEKPPLDMDVVVAKAQAAVEAERTTPRPQVERMLLEDTRK